MKLYLHTRYVRYGYYNKSRTCKLEGKLKKCYKVAEKVPGSNKTVCGYGFGHCFPVYTVHTEDCTDYSTLYNILSESYSNFMNQSTLANATKRGSGSGSFCCRCKRHR